MDKSGNEETATSMIDERCELLHELSNELQLFGEMTNQSMETEIELINDQSEFWVNCSYISGVIEQIEGRINDLLDDQETNSNTYDEQFKELKIQHSILENDLQNAKSMSRSIATKASIIRNKRISPILTLLWSMTSKRCNSEMISKYDDLYNVLFQFIEKADNVDTNLSVLGILVNISSSYQGRESIINAFHRSSIPCIKNLLNNYELLSTPRVKQLVLYLIKNISLCDRICIDLIREGCIKFCSDCFQLDIQSKNDFQIIIDVLDTLISMKYIKALNYYSEKELRMIYSHIKNFGDPDIKILDKIRDIIQINENDQQPKPKRFGVKRIYS